MSFEKAHAAATALEADFFFYYPAFRPNLCSRDGSVLASNLTPAAQNLIIAGISASRNSLYDAKKGKFLAGSLDQLLAHEEGF